MWIQLCPTDSTMVSDVPANHEKWIYSTMDYAGVGKTQIYVQMRWDEIHESHETTINSVSFSMVCSFSSANRHAHFCLPLISLQVDKWENPKCLIDEDGTRPIDSARNAVESCWMICCFVHPTRRDSYFWIDNCVPVVLHNYWLIQASNIHALSKTISSLLKLCKD